MRTVQFINHDHPAAKAAMITSNATRQAYFAARAQSISMRSRAAMDEAKRGLAWSERVHNRVTESLKSTPDAWIIREVSA